MAAGQWDLVVVGGGTAGLVASTTAAQLGARVALVESDRTGGECLWTGCVPSKALIAAAGAAASARRAPEKGVDVGRVEVDFARVMDGVRASIAAIFPHDSPETLRHDGVRVVEGRARFTGPSTVEVDGTPIGFRRAVVCTGSAPAVPDVPGLRDAASTLTSDTVWDLEELPRRLLVMGGGSIGCELGQAFARLGAQVTLVEAEDRLLPDEDPDASAVVGHALLRDGVTVLTGTSVRRVERRPDGSAAVHVEGGGTGGPVPVDAVLVAVGRRPRTEGLGLEAAGVHVDERGSVVVDEHLRTTSPRVWAAGDVTSLPAYTHVAGVNGAVAAANAVLGLRRAVDLSAVPRVTFTDPEVAAVGAPTGAPTGGSVGARGGRARTVGERHVDVDRAVVDGRTEGFSRLVLDRRRRVVGATLVGPRAGESLAEVTLAVRRRIGVGALTSTMHPYPTYGDGVWNAAVADSRSRLDHRVVRAVTGLVVRLRRGGR